jgi:hypothetical protein
MRNVLDKRCRENQNTHFMFNNFSENCALYEIMSKNVVQPERPQMTSQSICFSCWIITITRTYARAHTHNQICHIYRFSMATMVRKSASVLRHIYKVVQMWPGQTVTCLHTNSPGHIWTTLYTACLVLAREEWIPGPKALAAIHGLVCFTDFCGAEEGTGWAPWA